MNLSIKKKKKKKISSFIFSEKLIKKINLLRNSKFP